MSVELPNCQKCRHYYITHDPDRPYGCRAMGFKSRRNPAQVVYATSGIICQLFRLKSVGDADGSGKQAV